MSGFFPLWVNLGRPASNSKVEQSQLKSINFGQRPPLSSPTLQVIVLSSESINLVVPSIGMRRKSHYTAVVILSCYTFTSASSPRRSFSSRNVTGSIRSSTSIPRSPAQAQRISAIHPDGRLVRFKVRTEMRRRSLGLYRGGMRKGEFTDLNANRARPI